MKNPNKILTLFNRCKKYNVKSIWQCPEFLFFIFGIIIIAAIIITNFLASAYAGPELAAILAIVVTIPLLIIAYSVTKSFEYLAEASEIKSEFIRIMSHQLRTPLVAIKWQLESYFAKKEQNIKTETEIQNSNSLIKIVAKQNDELLKLINKFLTLKKIEENNFSLNKEDFSVVKLIKEIADYKNSLFINNLIIFKNNYEDLNINADREKIKIVLENLIDNALKYSADSKEVEIEAVKENNFIKIIIKDKGSGVKPDSKENIFSKQTADGVDFIPLTAERTPGLYVGLYLSRIIVEKHKGKIDFETKEGEGSTFWFTVPIN